MIVSPHAATMISPQNASSGSSARRDPERVSRGPGATGATKRGALTPIIGTSCSTESAAVMKSTVRSPDALPTTVPRTGPTTQPRVNPIRTVEMTWTSTPSAISDRRRLSSSRTAAYTCAPAAPATPSATTLMTNGIQSWVTRPMAVQPSPPTTAPVRKRVSRSGRWSDRRPRAKPTTGAVTLVR